MYKAISNLLLMSTLAVCFASVGTFSYRLDHTLAAMPPHSTVASERPLLLSGLQVVQRDRKADWAGYRSEMAHIREAVNRTQKVDRQLSRPAIQIIARAGKSAPALKRVGQKPVVQAIASLAGSKAAPAGAKPVRVTRLPEELVFTPVAALTEKASNVAAEPVAPRTRSSLMLH